VPDYDYYHPRLQVGLIGPDATEITWGATLVSNHVGGQDPRSVPASDDGKYVAVGGWGQGAGGYGTGVAMVDIAARQELWTKVLPSDNVFHVAFSPDSRLVYAGSMKGIVYAMDVKTGNVLGKWYASESGKTEEGNRISCLAVSPDGRWVAAGVTGPDGLIFVGSAATNKLVQVLKHGMGTVDLVHFSPDSKALATFVPDTLKIWNVSQWDKTPQATASGQKQPVAAAQVAQPQAVTTQPATTRSSTSQP
jgi:hypothetical protein